MGRQGRQGRMGRMGRTGCGAGLQVRRISSQSGALHGRRTDRGCHLRCSVALQRDRFLSTFLPILPCLPIQPS